MTPTNTQPEALRLADILAEDAYWVLGQKSPTNCATIVRAKE